MGSPHDFARDVLSIRGATTVSENVESVIIAKCPGRFFGNRVEQLELARLKFEEKHRGHWKAHRTHIFSGKLDIKELTASFKDKEITALRSWERDAFRAVFGVPAEILGLTSNSNRAAITQAMRIMASEVVVPRLEHLRANMQTFLVPYFDENIILDYVSPVPEDRELQLSFMTAQPYAATRGEWRAMQGLEDRGAVDNVHMMPLNIMMQRPAAGTGAGATALAVGSKSVRKDADAIAARIAERLRPETLVEETEPYWYEELEAWVKRTHVELGIAPAFNKLNPLVREHMETFSSTRIKRVNETTKAAVRATLSEGISQGEGMLSLASA